VNAVPLKFVAGVAYGLGQPPREADDGVPVLRATNIHRGKIVRDGLMLADPSDVPWERCPPLTAGEILVVRSGAYTGDSAIVTQEWEGAAPGYDLRITPTHIEPRYLAYFLLSRPARDYFNDCRGRAAQPHLNADQVANLRVPAVTRVRQRAITEFLDAETARIDALVGVRRRQAGLLVERQRAACRAIVTGGETPYPTGPLRRWWAVIDCKHRTPAYVDDGIPLISTGEVKQGLLDLSRTDRYVSRIDYKDLAEPPRRPRRGDVIYSRNASLGAAAYVDTDEEFCMGQDVCLISSQAEDQRFLAYALDLVAREELDARSIGSTFKRINVDQIKDLRVPHPSPAEQRRIAADCVRMDTATARAIAAIDRQTALLRERRQALITAAVTGKLQVPGATMTNAAA
jgi:type I restriction enzyme S subunit